MAGTAGSSSRQTRQSATNDLREVIASFDNEPCLRGADFADVILEAISNVRIISCSRVSLSEIIFLLQSCGAPDLPDIPDESEYQTLKEWINRRMEADPDDVPDPDPIGIEVLSADSSSAESPSTTEVESKEEIELPAGNNGDSRRFPVSFVTASDDKLLPRRSLSKLSQELEHSVSNRPTVTRNRGNLGFSSDNGTNTSRRTSGSVSFSISPAASFATNLDPGTRSGDDRQTFHEVPRKRPQMNPGVSSGTELRRRSNHFHGYRGTEDLGTLRSKSFVQPCKIYTRDKQFSDSLLEADSMSLAEVEQNYISASENLNVDPENCWQSSWNFLSWTGAQ
jgi:hypothetical protein